MANFPERVATENRFFELWGTLATPASPWGALAEEPRPATPGQVKGSQWKWRSSKMKGITPGKFWLRPVARYMKGLSRKNRVLGFAGL